MAIDLEALVRRFETMLEEDRAAVKTRETAGTGALQEVVGMFGPDFVEGLKAQAIEDATSQFAQAGLGMTSRPMAVSAPLGAEFKTRATKLRADALTRLAEFMGGFRDPTAVTPATLAFATTGGFQGQRELEREALAEAFARADREEARRSEFTDWLRDFSGGGSVSSSDVTFDRDPFGAPLGGTGTLSNLSRSLSTKPVSYTPTFQPFTAEERTGAATNLATMSDMTPRQAMLQFSTYEEFKAWAQAKGLNVGTKAEWAAVKRRVGSL